MKKGFFVGIIIHLIATSCSNKNAGTSEKTIVPDIINKITELPEYKKEERIIDSLKTNGVDVDIQIVILPDEVHPEDSLSVAFIEENFGFDQNQVCEIKFEKTTQKIISVKTIGSNPLMPKNEKIEKVK